MGLVIAVISGKGGVGKTTATANIGLGIAMNGKKCVVVDFDIGQRNLDMILGLESRVVYDIVQVMEGTAKMKQALIKSKVSDNLFFLPASQSKDKTVLESEKVRKFIDEIRKDFDFIILDSPAGIESGFEHTIEFADAAIIVVNPEVSSIRDADRAIGIVDSKSQVVKDGGEVSKSLIVNRISPEMVKSGAMLKTEDILEILDVTLIGQVPEDKGVIDASNQGKPIILNKKSMAGQAYTRIAGRMCGDKIPMDDVEIDNIGLFKKIGRMFS